MTIEEEILAIREEILACKTYEEYEKIREDISQHCKKINFDFSKNMDVVQHISDLAGPCSTAPIM